MSCILEPDDDLSLSFLYVNDVLEHGVGAPEPLYSNAKLSTLYEQVVSALPDTRPARSVRENLRNESGADCAFGCVRSHLSS